MLSIAVMAIQDIVEPLTPAERGVATLIILTLALTTAAIVFLRFKSIRSWLDSRFRVALGTVGGVAAVVAITAALLVIWGQADRISDIFDQQISPDTVIKFMMSVVILIITFGATRFIEHSVEHVADEQSTFDRHSQQVFTRFAQVITFIIGLIFAVSVWDVDLSNLLLGAGALSVVLGFAARQTLSASLAGFILMLSQPFKIGDWIEIGDKRGRVMKITVVNTRLRSHTGEYIILPNDLITDAEVTNLSDMGRLQLSLDVGVDYETDLDTAMTVIEDSTREVTAVMDTPGPSVHPQEFDDSSITLRVYFWIDNPSETRRRRARADVIAAIKEGFDAENITIPFPQRTLVNRNSDERVNLDADTNSEPPE